MSKILSVDKKFVYIDDDGKLIEVKLNDLNFEPIPGNKVIVHRFRNSEISHVELVKEEPVKKGVKKQVAEKPVSKKKKPPVKAPKKPEVKAAEPTEAPTPPEPAAPPVPPQAPPIPAQAPPAIKEVEAKPAEVVTAEQEEDICKVAKHGNRFIEFFIGIFTLLILGGALALFLYGVDFSTIADNIIKLAIVGGAILVGIIYIILALSLPKGARIVLNSLVIVAYILVFGLSIYFIVFDDGLQKLIDLVPQLQRVQNFIDNRPILKYYPFILNGASLLPLILGIIYFARIKSYKRC